MPKYYVKDKNGNWNIYSTIVDRYLINEFVDFEKVKEYELKEKEKELDSLLTNTPQLNIMDYDEAEFRMAYRKEIEELSKGKMK